MRPQLLIGAVLSISGSFAIGAQPAALTGMPSTDYSTHTLVLHIQDYGNLRLEMGEVGQKRILTQFVHEDMIRRYLENYREVMDAWQALDPN